jgi:undecaprenyl-diphosphatase
MSNIIIRKIFEELTFFGGIAFYMFLVVVFFVLGKIDSVFKLILGLIFIYLVTFIIRLFYFKPRPKKIGYKNLLEKIDASSFPSVHAARAVFLCFFIVFLFNLSWVVDILIGILMILVIYSRIYLLKHDIIDAIGGILLGILSLVVFILV